MYWHTGWNFPEQAWKQQHQLILLPVHLIIIIFYMDLNSHMAEKMGIYINIFSNMC